MTPPRGAAPSDTAPSDTAPSDTDLAAPATTDTIGAALSASAGSGSDRPGAGVNGTAAAEHGGGGDRDGRSGTFSSLVVPNYRRFMSGQAISLIGTWMQSVAQAWLVLQLTGSGTWLGLVIAAQTLPVLIGGPYGGVIVDRVDKRKLLLITQAVKGTDSLILGVLAVTGHAHLWEVFVLAAVFGMSNCLDNPARQSFVQEMVGPEHVRNAVTLNSVMVNAARAVGPAIAGVLIATIGVGVCFFVDAGSYVAVIVALFTLNLKALYRGPKPPRANGQFLEGLRYVRSTPTLFVPLMMMVVVGTLAYEFQVALPVMAKHTFHGGASSYGVMTAAMGIGAVIGGLRVAGRGRSGIRPVVIASGLFGVAICATAFAPTLIWAMVGLLFVGAGSVSFLAVANTTLQLSSAPHMRGRVMALWSVAFLGSTPIGGPIIGFISQHAGARYGLLVGGVSAILAAGAGGVSIRRRAAQSRAGSTAGATAGSTETAAA